MQHYKLMHTSTTQKLSSGDTLSCMFLYTPEAFSTNELVHANQKRVINVPYNSVWRGYLCHGVNTALMPLDRFLVVWKCQPHLRGMKMRTSVELLLLWLVRSIEIYLKRFYHGNW